MSRMLPMVTIFMLVLIAALPWGLPSPYRIALPLLPVIAIHYWTLRHDALVPEWMVFIAGLLLDILTHGPLGFWALIYLLTYLMALFGQSTANKGPGTRLVALLAAVVIAATGSWLLASAYAFAFIDGTPFVRGAIFAALATIFILPMLRALDRPRAAFIDRFSRGTRL